MVLVGWNDAKFPTEVAQKVFRADNGVEDESRSMDVPVKLLQEGMYQGCLTRTHLTCEDGEASMIFDPPYEFGQCLLVFRTQVEGAWVRRDVKRLPGKTKMALIRWKHGLDVSGQTSTRVLRGINRRFTQILADKDSPRISRILLFCLSGEDDKQKHIAIGD